MDATEEIWLAFKTAMRKRVDRFNKKHRAKVGCSEEESDVFAVAKWAYQHSGGVPVDRQLARLICTLNRGQNRVEVSAERYALEASYDLDHLGSNQTAVAEEILDPFLNADDSFIIRHTDSPLKQ
jgi:hypothetical protein